ncbi:AfsR/SARP family transcriptional regulator [Amycolatopsis samaneae]|uniref:AfsR/SARP family transcriptional regulator n=1 Tax=Amycolatopsis samaneae TaxID=664691 RepID=A0ABW5GTB4_9PSEU
MTHAERTVPNAPYDAAPASGGTGSVRFAVLGPVEVIRDGTDHAPSTPKVLQLLAMLLMRPGKVVHTEAIIEELWDEAPPRSARTTLNTYVYHLRRCIDRHRLAPDGEAMLVRKPPGYVLRIDPAQVDVFAFRQLQRKGHAEQARGEHAAAAASFRAALDLWTGQPFANVHCGPVLSAYAAELLERRRGTRQSRIEAELSSGAHHELIGELRSLAAADPLDEAVHGQLMRLMARSGRRSDAMATYRRLRVRLNEELGVQPCERLQRLYSELIHDGGASVPPGRHDRRAHRTTETHH